MMRISAASVLVIAFCLPPAARATNYTWGNAAGGNWNVSGNWSPSGIPGTSDNVALNALAGSYTVLVTDTRGVNNFDLNYANAALTVTGSWTVAGTASIDVGTFNLTGGSMTVNGVFVTDTTGTSNWSGGTLQGTGTLYGILNVLNGSNNLVMNGTTLKNAGTIAWNSGGILTNSFSTVVLTNQSTGVIDFKADGSAFANNSGGTGTIVNQGTLRKSAGTGTAGTTVGWAVDFQNGSTVDVLTGTLKFTGGGTLRNGTIILTGSGTAALDAETFTVPNGSTFTAPANGGNPLNLTGGTLAANGILAGTLSWTGGMMTGGTPSVPGTLGGIVNVTSGVNNQTVNGIYLQNSGVINWTSGGILTNSFSTVALTNASSGLIDFKADGSAFANNSGGSGTLINQGTLRKSAGTGTAGTTVGWAIDFLNGSTVDVQSGALKFTGGGTLRNGTIILTGSGTASLDSGTFTIAIGSTFTSPANSGNPLNLSGGTLAVNGFLAGTLSWTGGMLAGTDPSAPSTLAGTINVTSGVTNQTINGIYLQNSGVINWTSGTMLTNSFSTVALTNLPAGVIEFKADGNAFANNSGGNGTLISQGTLRKSGGTGTAGTNVAWPVEFQNGTILNVLTGTLNFTTGGTLQDGTLTVTGTAVAALNNGTFTIPGNATFTSAGTGSNFLRWTGGILTAGTEGGTLAGTLIAASSSNNKTISGNTLFNAGTLAWTGGTINADSNSTVLTSLPGAVIDFRVDGTAFNSSSATIVSHGTIRKSAGAINPTVVGWAVDFRSGGTLDAVVGTLNFNGGGTLNAGTTTVTGTAIVALNQGTFTVTSGQTFTAAGTAGNYLRWTGGTLTGGVLGGTLAGNLIANTGANTKVIAGNTLFNAGTLAWVAGTINSANSSTVQFTNQSTGIIDIQSDGTVFALGSSSTANLVNEGILRKTVGVLNPAVISGWTVANSGTIQVTNAGTLNFTGSVTNTGTITMVSGATIGGTTTSNAGGFVKGPAGATATYSGAKTFNSGSTLQPGGGTAGRLNLGSTLTMNSGSTYFVKLAGTTPVTGYSQTSVTGLITLSNATLSIDTTGYVPDTSAKYFILLDGNASPITGTFNGQPNGSGITFGGFYGVISYTGNSTTGLTTGGRDVVIYNVVPEPTGMVTAGFAASGLFAAFRRFRRRAVPNA